MKLEITIQQDKEARVKKVFTDKDEILDFLKRRLKDEIKRREVKARQQEIEIDEIEL